MLTLKENPQLSTYHIKQNCTATTVRRRTTENNCSNTHHCKNRELEDKIKTSIGKQEKGAPKTVHAKTTGM